MKRLIFWLVALAIIALLAAMLLPVSGPRPALNVECRFHLSDLEIAITNYQVAYTNYPAGNHSEIIKCLLGDNPKRIQFININSNNLSSNVEYLDPWKTPYAINFHSNNRFIISSAGKDKKFGDADDIIFNSASNDFVKP